MAKPLIAGIFPLQIRSSCISPGRFGLDIRLDISGSERENEFNILKNQVIIARMHKEKAGKRRGERKKSC